MAHGWRLVVALGCLALAGCAGSFGTGAISSGHSTARSVAAVGPPAPFDPKSDANALRAVSTADAALPDVRAALARLERTGVRTSMASAGPSDDEVAGIKIQPGGYYSAIYARQSAYAAAQIQVAYPTGSTDTSAIYESMTAPNGGCLGNFATWINSGSGTQAVFSVYDYCAAIPGVVYATPIDAVFLAKYTQPNAAGIPMYASEIYTFDLQPQATSRWTSILYNYQTGAYETLAHSTGVLASRTTGFAQWTTQLQPQPCPVIPPMGSDYIELYDNQRNRFELAAPTMTDTTTIVEAPSTQSGCFSQSGGGTSYAFSVAAPNRTFTITAAAGVAGYTTMTFTPPISAEYLAAGSTVDMWYSGGAGGHFGYVKNGALVDFPGNGGGTLGAVAADPAGSVWFPFLPPHGYTATGLDRSDTGGTLTPYATVIQPRDVVAGGDGNMWTVAGGDTSVALQKFVPGSPGATGTYAVSGTMSADVPGAIALGPDGNLWFIIDNYVNGTTRLYKGTTSGAITLAANWSGTLNDITGAPSGLFITDAIGHRVIRFALNGTQTVYPLSSGAGGIATAPNGDVWFVENQALAHLAVASGMITEYAVDPGAKGTSPEDVAVDAAGNVWVCTVDRIIEYTFH